MSSYLVERIEKIEGCYMSNKNLVIGTNSIVAYYLEDRKVMVKRYVSVVDEDILHYYVDTGYLQYTPILKKNIITVEQII